MDVNIKQLLIEKERFAYLENNPSLAQFFASTLDYILHLEEMVNTLDSHVETLQEQVYGSHARE